MRRILSLLICTVMALTAAACSNGGRERGEKLLGIVMPNATHGFMGESIKHAEAAAKEFSEIYGIKALFQTSADANEQSVQIDALIEQGADAIVLWQHGRGDIREAAQRVIDAGIQLVVYDRLIPDITPDVEIEGDNEGIGSMAGEYFSRFFEEELESGNVYYLEFKGDRTTVTAQRSDGFNAAKNDGLVSAGEFFTDWQTQSAREQMEKYLSESSDEDIEKIRAVHTHDDEVALGILQAVQNYNGNAALNIRLISGVSGSRAYLDTFAPVLAELGISQVTYEYSPSMVRTAVETGMKILSGETVSARIVIPTFEIDNGNEAEYRNSAVYTTRYSLKPPSAH